MLRVDGVAAGKTMGQLPVSCISISESIANRGNATPNCKMHNTGSIPQPPSEPRQQTLGALTFPYAPRRHTEPIRIKSASNIDIHRKGKDSQIAIDKEDVERE